MAAHAPKIDSSIDPKTYADYAGYYDYKTGFRHITVKDGHIYSQLPGQQVLEIFPSGPGEFFFEVVESQLVFNRDKTGAVISVTHTQEGLTSTALKVPDSQVPGR
jgi:hypothetical protein